MEHTHRWRLAVSMPLSSPDVDGWVAMLLIRACNDCAIAECFHGARHEGRGRSRLASWEVWGNVGLLDEGDTFSAEWIAAVAADPQAHDA